MTRDNATSSLFYSYTRSRLTKKKEFNLSLPVEGKAEEVSQRLQQDICKQTPSTNPQVKVRPEIKRRGKKKCLHLLLNEKSRKQIQITSKVTAPSVSLVKRSRGFQVTLELVSLVLRKVTVNVRKKDVSQGLNYER
jgi:hypothetical protein